MSELLKKIKEIQNNLKGQDNYCTAYPLYQVRRRFKQAGLEQDFDDNGHIWIDSYGDWVREPKIIAALDEMHASDEEISRIVTIDDWDYNVRYGDYIFTYWKWEEEVIQTFVTEKAAKSYIENNSHRHKGELIMYVDSAYRNQEMIDIIEFLKTTIISF